MAKVGHTKKRILSTNQKQFLATEHNSLVNNLLSQRVEVMRRLMGPSDRDLNGQLGYPDVISVEDYVNMYERNGVAETVVEIYPQESFSVTVEAYETERARLTQFEREYLELEEKLNLQHYLERVDIASGIGHYGVLLYGLSDGNELDTPVPGLTVTGERGPNFKPMDVLYLSVFAENNARVTKLEDDPTNPRFRRPIEYELTFPSTDSGGYLTPDKLTVHWTRVRHVADNLRQNDIYGKPRMRSVFNRLLDLQKLLGGSAEMFWKGAFPGYAFEINPEFAALAGLTQDTAAAEALKDKVKDEMFKMSENLQRYIALIGVSVKPLMPQVANPLHHIEAQLRDISIAIKSPYSVFIGAEAGKLAASQQLRLWNKRVKSRQRKYLDPLLYRPVIRDLIKFGALKRHDSKLLTYWPDLDTLSEQDRADVADKRATALQKYVTGKVEQTMPPYEFLTMVMGYSAQEAKVIIKASEKYQKEYIEKLKALSKAQAAGKPKQAGGAANTPNGQKVPGGQNPKTMTAPRSRTGAGASGVVN